ncbi:MULTISPECIES: glutathione S-transferase family protein [Sphingomonas]|uniref:glutathione S-transferase family protein n=1 Tax=Sphingomonas TaxID=13687 RepID=UPI000DEFF480|nr:MULTISPECIES: glutathione S-transferase family protein [Sphingomonas]
MAELIFYTNPQSRGQIVRWMLEEVGAPYTAEYLGYGTSMKEEPYLSVNPMGKVPAIKHGDKVVTEVSAICAYLADAFPDAGLAPALDDRADYYRFLFFAAGPLEAAFSNKAAGFVPTPERERMFGYGNWDQAIGGIERMLTGRDYITGKFSAADLYVTSELGFMMMFGMLEPRPVFADYVARCTDRDAYRRAKQRDEQAAEELKASA